MSPLLKNMVTTASEAPLSRWDSDAIIASMASHNDSSTLDRIRYGSFLTDEMLESFDSRLFGISDAEAAHMAPSQRLLLTVAHEAFQDAGYTMASLRGRNIGVFLAASGSTSVTSSAVTSGVDLHQRSVYDATGSALSVAAGRISFTFGLQGPFPPLTRHVRRPWWPCMQRDEPCNTANATWL
jgi:acyl transferase domain-containing protein